MMHDIPDSLLQDISEWIVSQTGLFFPPQKWRTLKKAAQSTAAAFGMDAHAFMENILPPSPDERLLDALVMHLTIGETYFLRDKHVFQLLKDHIFQELVSKQLCNNQTIRILSAGCASGEEPYSIAILIDQVFPAIRKKDIAIIGTDINPLFLEKARKGIYSQWSLRETPESIIARYFIPLGAGAFALSEHIRGRVRFCRLNLMEVDYPARLGSREPFHIIFCRNVLMYFEDRNRSDVLAKLTGLMAEDGWLITGPAETGFVQSPELMSIRFANTTLHRKCAAPKAQKPKSMHSFHARRLPQTKPDAAALRPEILNKKPFIPQPQPGIPDEKPDIVAYQKALDLYEKGDYAAAASRLEHLMKNVNTAGAGFLMAPEAMILLARAHANLGRIQAARQWCDYAIASEKLNPQFHYFRATILQSAGDIPAAIQSLKQAIFLDQDFIMAHFMTGLLTKSSSGKKYLKNALALLGNRDPDDVPPFSEGMTAARLSETINNMIRKKGHA